MVYEPKKPDGMTIYKDNMNMIDLLDDCEKGKLLQAMMDYFRFKTEPNFSDERVLTIAWARMKSSLDTNEENYKETCKSRSQSGKKGADARWHKQEDDNKSMANDSKCHQELANDDESCLTKLNQTKLNQTKLNETIVSMGEKSTRFVPPTPNDVNEYALSKGKTIDAERFVNFYESKGWMIGKNKMKNWRSAVSNWIKDDESKSQSNCYAGPDYWKQREIEHPEEFVIPEF